MYKQAVPSRIYVECMVSVLRTVRTAALSLLAATRYGTPRRLILITQSPWCPMFAGALLLLVGRKRWKKKI